MGWIIAIYGILGICLIAFCIYIRYLMHPRDDQEDHGEGIRHPIIPERFPIERQERERQMMQDEGFVYFEKIHQAAKILNFPEAVRLAEEHLSHFDLTQEHFATSAHFFLINCVQNVYFYRDEDPLAYNHCLMLCDMDIALYPYIDRSIVRHNPVLPEKKAIIMEKMGWYEDALRVCEEGIKNEWGTSSMPWESRAERLKKKSLPKLPRNN